MRYKIDKGVIQKTYFFYVDNEVIDIVAKSRRRAKRLISEAFPHKPIIYIAKEKKRVF